MVIQFRGFRSRRRVAAVEQAPYRQVKRMFEDLTGNQPDIGHQIYRSRHSDYL